MTLLAWRNSQIFPENSFFLSALYRGIKSPVPMHFLIQLQDGCGCFINSIFILLCVCLYGSFVKQRRRQKIVETTRVKFVVRIRLSCVTLRIISTSDVRVYDDVLEKFSVFD